MKKILSILLLSSSLVYGQGTRMAPGGVPTPVPVFNYSNLVYAINIAVSNQLNILMTNFSGNSNIIILPNGFAINNGPYLNIFYDTGLFMRTNTTEPHDWYTYDLGGVRTSGTNNVVVSITTNNGNFNIFGHYIDDSNYKGGGLHYNGSDLYLSTIGVGAFSGGDMVIETGGFHTTKFKNGSLFRWTIDSSGNLNSLQGYNISGVGRGYFASLNVSNAFFALGVYTNDAPYDVPFGFDQSNGAIVTTTNGDAYLGRTNGLVKLAVDYNNGVDLFTDYLLSASLDVNTNVLALDFMATNGAGQRLLYAYYVATSDVRVYTTNTAIGRMLSYNIVASGGNRKLYYPTNTFHYPNFTTNGWTLTGPYYTLILTNGNELRMSHRTNTAVFSTLWQSFGQ